MKQYKVGIIGATGMVGQRFVTLLCNHPWFEIKVLAASQRSANLKYKDAVKDRWSLKTPMPQNVGEMVVLDAENDMKTIANEVDFVFCAVNLKKDKIKQLEEAYAKLECPVISNNSAHRTTKDVPMIIPEINSEHAQIIISQRKRLGTKKGFIAVKSNCSLQSYVPPLSPLIEEFGLKKVLACTYQAISGAGKTFSRWPQMQDNIIPYIEGEEEKSETEPLKIWGEVENGEIKLKEGIDITTQCLRVPVSDGHMAAVFASFEKEVSLSKIKKIFKEYKGEPQRLDLVSAPKQFLNYFEDPSRPQTKLDRNLENGMAIGIGRLREDSQYDIKFVCLSHNTLRGAAGGAVLMAELLAAKGFFD